MIMFYDMIPTLHANVCRCVRKKNSLRRQYSRTIAILDRGGDAYTYIPTRPSCSHGLPR